MKNYRSLTINSYWFAFGCFVTGIAVRLDHKECVSLQETFIFPAVLLLLWLLLGILIYIQKRHLTHICTTDPAILPDEYWPNFHEEDCDEISCPLCNPPGR